jgi:hypothetical protein
MSWNDPNWQEAAWWYYAERRGETLIVEPSRVARDIHRPRESINAFYNRAMREHRKMNGPSEAEIIAEKMRRKK